MPYESTDQGSDAFGMIGAVSGSGGQGFFEDRESMVKGGLRAGMSIANGAASIAKSVGAASSVAGPIGAAVAFTLDTCINFYEASQDLGKANSKIAALKGLESRATGDTKEIVTWLINKLGRRVNYDHAETGGSHLMADSAKESWSQGGPKGRATAVAKGVGLAVATPVTTVAGQLGSQATRAARGFLKKTGLMGSKRKEYARTLYDLATKRGDKVAKEVLIIVLAEGVANQGAAQTLQEQIDDVMISSLEKGMSSFKA
jgi:hypothetical protein